MINLGEIDARKIVLTPKAEQEAMFAREFERSRSIDWAQFFAEINGKEIES